MHACMQAEDAFREVDVALGSYRARVGVLEAQLRARDADVSRLHKLLDQSRSAELELEAKHAKVTQPPSAALDVSAWGILFKSVRMDGCSRP